MQSLELVIRLFLNETENSQHVPINLGQLKEGDEVQSTPFTNYDSLSVLIEKINSKLKELNRDERIDDSLVKLRDAIAHGRLLSSSPQRPQSPEDHFKLYKFSREDTNHMVRVEVAVDISLEELKRQKNLVLEACKKVTNIGHSLGFECFPDTIS
ncbi:MAG: hypothetical protein JW849_11520 [Phycisphaerae bacterium]|nr:hypothetical protein [Phycisphaerae bacterium]